TPDPGEPDAAVAARRRPRRGRDGVDLELAARSHRRPAGVAGAEADRLVLLALRPRRERGRSGEGRDADGRAGRRPGPAAPAAEPARAGGLARAAPGPPRRQGRRLLPL